MNSRQSRSFFLMSVIARPLRLSGVPAVLVGRPQTWDFDRPLAPDERVAYRESQRAAILRALSEYAPDPVVVFDVDFGHTSPQQPMPYGGTVRVDGAARRISVLY